MNQPMDFNTTIQSYFLGAAIRMTGMMMLELMFTILPRERERLIETLCHEPSQEDWDDYSQFLGERTLVPKCLQRAKDRDKIRRLVFGEDNASS
jgi:hypothetical protein